MTDVAITQSDVVTAYGWGIESLWNGLLSGKTAIQSTQQFAERNFVSDQAAFVPNLEVDNGGSRVRAMLDRLCRPLVDTLDPATALILTTTVGEIEHIERAVLCNDDQTAQLAQPVHLLEHLRRMLRLTGPAMVLSSACASSAVALSRAASMVRHGEAPSVLVVACDAVSEFVYSGFSTLMSLAEQPAQPFDAERAGLTLGEAATWALVSSTSTSNENAVKLLGWGSTTDAVHMTAPDRYAGGLTRAIEKACAMAMRSKSDVAFVAAHGTATVYSDAMELLAFRSAFVSPRPIFSIKGGIGHTLAAAGLAQILVAGRALALGRVPPTVGLQRKDDNAIGWAHDRTIGLPGARIALSTNSGFGGVNTAILLGRNVA
jgi:3-oxoacyl-[acyl-carrier-protein] synthase II